MKTTPCFVVAQQRSGTHYFRSMLASTGIFTDIGEVFEGWVGPLDQEINPWHRNLNFFKFRAIAYREVPESSVPHESNNTEVFEQFLEHCAEYATTKGKQSRYLLIDVKYNSLHHLNKLWFGPAEMPSLLQWAGKKGAKIVHLVRRDEVARVVSHMVADETSKFHFFKDRSYEEYPAVTLPLEEFKMRIDRQRKDALQASEWMDELGERIVLTQYYEDLNTVDSFIQNAKPALEKHLDLVLPNTFSTHYRKGLSDPRSVVSNLDEVLQVASDMGCVTALV